MFGFDALRRGTKQTMSRTMLPRALASRAKLVPDCRVLGLVRRGDRVVMSTRCRHYTRGGGVERMTVHAEHVFVCGGAVHSPALLQRGGIWRNIGNGLKMHPTIKVAARFPHPVDHGDVPMRCVTEFSPFIAIDIGQPQGPGRAGARRHQRPDEAMADWRTSRPTTPPSAARAAGGCWPCGACAPP